MDQNQIREVDPKLLARAYAVFSRVVTGVSKYTRDEDDTLSPMMARLRDDGAKDPLVIDGFLAVQRFLVLNLKSEDLFSYTHRLLFILECSPADMHLMAKAGDKILDAEKNPFLLPWNRNPAQDAQSAAWFAALASTAFQWHDSQPRTMQELFLHLDSVAERIWNYGKFNAFSDVEWQPDPKVEAHDPDKHEKMLAEVTAEVEAADPKTTLH